MWLLIRLANSRIYWTLRSLRDRLIFSLSQIIFRGRSNLADVAFSSQILIRLFWAALGASVLAAVASAVVLMLGRFTGDVAKQDIGSYDSVLIAVTAVVGVFLSLYLTAISTVAGTTYARLPEQVRNSLVSERVGNVYVRYLIFLTILSLLLLAVAVLTDSRPQAGIVAVVFLTVIAVFAFAALSSRVFQFFDPTSLATTFLYDLDRWSNQATTSGYQWSQGAFQHYYRRRAHLALGGVTALADIALHVEDLKKEPLRRLISQVVNFAAIYIGRQEKIPSSSRWYDLVPQYKDWYLSSDHEVGLRSATMTSLQPEMKPDPQWLERSLTDLAVNSMRVCLSDGRIETGLDILAQVTRFFDSKGAAWQIEDGFRLLDQIQSTTISLARSEPAINGARPNLRDQLGAIELTAQIPIHMLLAFYGRLRSYEISALADRMVVC